ncbi:MAG: endonuclease III [Candidatus Hydrothermarchaeales archaeon]
MEEKALTEEELKDRVLKILELLKKEYPKIKTALTFADPLDLLVATILSAQCTDVRVNMVTKELFKKYRTSEDYANADVETFENEIRSTGFYRNKAKNIIGANKLIIERFDSKVPDTMEELTQLPGVARKTANIVLSNAYGKIEGIAVDTHVKRLSKRLGLTRNKDQDKIEQDLMRITPKEEWSNLSHLLIFHGRAICQAKKPRCDVCVLNFFCPSSLV